MINEYGLDVEYFKSKLELILRDISYFTPKELSTELKKYILILEEEEKNDNQS